jgi:tRNA A37 threonylcarbamoyladenosine dehydratase
MAEWTESGTFKRRIRKVQNANVLVVGLGGVGSFAAEFFWLETGVGSMTIVRRV